jgi:hypothetical protein
MTDPVKPELSMRDRISRRLDKQREVDRLCKEYYDASNEGRPLPQIDDGLVRDYAYVIGQTLHWREKFRDDRDCLRVHNSAISSFHGIIADWQQVREELGLPISADKDAISKAMDSNHVPVRDDDTRLSRLASTPEHKA